MSGARNIVRVALAIALAMPAVASAHPIPSSQHDRTIVLRVEEGDAPGQVRVRINYRLELAEDTARIDIAPFVDDIDIKAVRRSPAGYYNEFTRLIAPFLAQNLGLQLDGKPLTLVCREHRHTFHDENKQVLGHLRCDFVFQVLIAPPAGAEHVLKLEEKNYPADLSGLIHVSVLAGPGIRVLEKHEPDDALRSRPTMERLPEDDRKLRSVSLRFSVGTAAASAAAGTPPVPMADAPKQRDDHEGLFHLFISSEHGFVLLLLLSAWVGAVHALTPGHGKTLVAAYLVGQQGTIGHAIVLGLVTTLTHTGAVLLLAFLLRFFSEGALASVQVGLGMVMGLLIACLGFWLLLQRLAGRADHVHLSGNHHHHHHHNHHHHHHEHHDHLPTAPAGKVTWWGLIVLGMSGGIIPCWDAIAMLVLAIGANQLALALPMLLAFSAGLASVLVLLGILVVKLRNFAGSRWGNGRIVRALPLVSALLVTAMGIWLCYESVHATR
ncbi:MAG: hypothetical protein FJ271_16045 [Planctomycetes bacterium]|nr:hypothetical protein [Planctomycetota bacterium]